MPSQTTDPTNEATFPAEDERTLPGPQRGPSAARVALVVLLALLMLIGAVLLG